MLNFIYYPVSWILWFWHEVFSFVFPGDGWPGGIAWALSVIFLVFTLRGILYKPFVAQVRSMRKMQEFQPEMQKLRKKYANDKQKQAAEMQRLQKEHGVNPLFGCLPVLLQVPVFIGLFHVLREFGPLNGDGSVRTQNYGFDAAGVHSFNAASLFGAKLGSWATQGPAVLEAAGTSLPNMIIVMAPLMIAAGVFTHITARHSVARQNASAAASDNPQTAIMQKLMLYVFPIGVVVGAPFLPLAILLYWVSNNLWTLGQQYLVYKKIDQEQSEKREQITATRQALAPKVGQKPVRPEPAAPSEEPPAKRPGAKPVTRSTPRKPAGASASNASATGSSNGSSNGSGNGSAKNSSGSSSNGSGTSSSGGQRPAARRPKKRR